MTAGRRGQDELDRDESRESGELVHTGMAHSRHGRGDRPAPVPGGIRNHLTRTKGIRIDYAVERVVARHPAAHEVRLLGLARSAPALALYVSARNASGNPGARAGRGHAR